MFQLYKSKTKAIRAKNQTNPIGLNLKYQLILHLLQTRFKKKNQSKLQVGYFKVYKNQKCFVFIKVKRNLQIRRDFSSKRKNF